MRRLLARGYDIRPVTCREISTRYALYLVRSGEAAQFEFLVPCLTVILGPGTLYVVYTGSALLVAPAVVERAGAKRALAAGLGLCVPSIDRARGRAVRSLPPESCRPSSRAEDERKATTWLALPNPSPME